MKEFKKTKKRYNILTVILFILAGIALVAGIALEFLAEIENDIALIFFIVALALVVLSFPLLIFIYKFQNKIAKKMIEELNKSLDREYTYQEGTSILDIVDDSMHPYELNMKPFSKDGIVGKYEDIDFEYYLCTFEKESLFSQDNKNRYELYVFKNVSVFSKSFFVTAKKLKNVEQYKVTPTRGMASIYTTRNDDIILDDLPKDVLFLSVNEHTLYVYKTPERKKPLFQLADDADDFKELFAKEIEKIKDTYEETKAWIK
ncbi:MAG: SecY family transport protein [Anaeroplasmataceae bacterium]|nr:SecY family transport protein [Anaeroplasmataceae bacterium]MDE6415290.1 SecY family transport protein [Anaeroplasmataceae bacterium]